MQRIKWFIQLSRPRFWMYLFGPFILGVAAAYNHLNFDTVNTKALIVSGLFFLFPANLLVYGVNDFYDYETDKNNPKKKSYETLIAPKNRNYFVKVLSVCVVPFVGLMVFLFLQNTSSIALWSLAGFLFFGVGYSMPPIRAKSKPFLDSFFNILYIFPGFIGYGAIVDAWPPITILFAATAWVMAMHAFSAIPDISSDKKAKLSTVATVLNKQKTIVYCGLLYLLSGLLTFGHLGIVSVLLAMVYVGIMVGSYISKDKKTIFTIYKLFPYVNMIAGGVIFWSVVLY